MQKLGSQILSIGTYMPYALFLTVKAVLLLPSTIIICIFNQRLSEKTNTYIHLLSL